MIEFRITAVGSASLLMHNSRLANPLDPAAKAVKKISGKRQKTDDDHEEMARLEHAGGLYFDADAGPFIPADNIWRCLYDAAKKSKRGPKIKEGVFIQTDVNPLSYQGPRTIEGLWADKNFVHFASAKVTTSRVVRCRPVFQQWKVDANGVLDPNVIDFAEIVAIAETAGQLVGLGDWRPRYGRFTATVEKL